MTAPSHTNDFDVTTFLAQDDDNVPLAAFTLARANSNANSNANSSTALNQNSTAVVLHESGGTSNETVNESTAVIAYDAEVQQLLREVEAVKRNRIANSTRNQYCAANVTFMIFLFKHFPAVLKPDFLELYTTLSDQGTPREFGRGVKESLEDNKKLPVDLTKLTTDMFMAYLLSLKRPNGNYYSISYYEGKKSAFLNLIVESGNQWYEASLKDVATIMVSLKKTIAKYNHDNGISVSEGKEHMSWSCYCLTCKLFIEDGSPSSLFGLFFLTLQWSLIARSESVEKIALDQLSYACDHMKVFFPKHKGDQIGLNKDEPRHVYSNPIQPEVCAMRAMASYFFTFPQIL